LSRGGIRIADWSPIRNSQSKIRKSLTASSDQISKRAERAAEITLHVLAVARAGRNDPVREPGERSV